MSFDFLSLQALNPPEDVIQLWNNQNIDPGLMTPVEKDRLENNAKSYMQGLCWDSENALWSTKFCHHWPPASDIKYVQVQLN